MNQEKYLLSFTAAYLEHGKSLILARAFREYGSWDEVKKRNLSENLLQARTHNAAERFYLELTPRIQTLTEKQLELLISGSFLEQKHMLWLAVCKRYLYIREFAIEVVREKFLRMDYQLSELDYRSFYNRKVDWHEELDEIAESTQEKLRQVLFKMLKEVEIINDSGLIIQTLLTDGEMAALKEEAPMSFHIFPVMISENLGENLNE